jgi:hypothetical protein
LKCWRWRRIRTLTWGKIYHRLELMASLLRRNQTEWQDQVTLFHDDMRTWQPPKLVDILISELLGSFGDNELSPECLDGAQRVLNRKSQFEVANEERWVEYLFPLPTQRTSLQLRRPATIQISCVEQNLRILALSRHHMLYGCKHTTISPQPSRLTRSNSYGSLNIRIRA